MKYLMRYGFVSILTAILLAGCQSPRTMVRPGTASPTVTTVSKSLVTITPDRIAFNVQSIPAIDPGRVTGDAPAFTFKAIDEVTAQCLAAANSSTANLLDDENARATTFTLAKHDTCPDFRGDDLVRELRRLMALEFRNKAAAEALDKTLQLADVTARTQLARDGLKVFDELRLVEAPKLRAAGLPAPDAEELLRQRAKLLADLATADAGLALINFDLKSRLGVELARDERLWPTGPFDITNELPDEDAAVQIALKTRAELQALRTLLRDLSPETLPAIRQQLQGVSGLLGSSSPAIAKLLAFRKPDTSLVDEAELATRRKQIQDLLIAKEAETTAQVKQALVQMTAAAAKTALLQARTASLTDKWQKAKAQNANLDALTAHLEAMRAESEVIAAAMEWHQWRVKLKAAQGLLGNECQSVK